MDERKERISLHDDVDISEAETQRKDHNEAQNRVQNNSPRDRSGQGFRGVFYLFGYPNNMISIAYRRCVTVPHLHICTPQSKPSMERMDVDKPTITDVPLEFHPPPLVNSVKTAVAVFRGARTHRGMTIAKRPTMCIIKINPSTIGNFLARNVLKRIAKEVMAITSIVPCQRSKTYVGSFRIMSPWMMVPAKNDIETIAHCQPVAQSQPIGLNQCMVSHFDLGFTSPVMKLKNFWPLLGANSDTQ